MAAPWLELLVAGLSQRTTGFRPKSVHARFVADRVSLAQFFSEYFRLLPVSFISPLHILIIFVLLLP